MTRLVPITRINVGVGTGKFLTPDPSGRNSLDRFTLCIIVAGSLSPLVGAVTSESGRWVFKKITIEVNTYNNPSQGIRWEYSNNSLISSHCAKTLKAR